METSCLVWHDVVFWKGLARYLIQVSRNVKYSSPTETTVVDQHHYSTVTYSTDVRSPRQNSTQHECLMQAKHLVQRRCEH